MFNLLFILKLFISIIKKRQYPATVWWDYFRTASWYFIKQDGANIYILNEMYDSDEGRNKQPQSISVNSEQKYLLPDQFAFVKIMLDSEFNGLISQHTQADKDEIDIFNKHVEWDLPVVEENNIFNKHVEEGNSTLPEVENELEVSTQEESAVFNKHVEEGNSTLPDNLSDKNKSHAKRKPKSEA